MNINSHTDESMRWEKSEKKKSIRCRHGSKSGSIEGVDDLQRFN